MVFKWHVIICDTDSETENHHKLEGSAKHTHAHTHKHTHTHTHILEEVKWIVGQKCCHQDCPYSDGKQEARAGVKAGYGRHIGTEVNCCGVGQPRLEKERDGERRDPRMKRIFNHTANACILT